MTSIGDSFSWPFADQSWPSKMLIQGLIALIPIIGGIALLGWLLITVDNYRAGRRVLAPAGFHLERGITLWLVFLVYVIVLGLPGGIINGIGGGTEFANRNALAGLGALLYLAAFVLLLFLSPAIILNTYRAGFRGGFDVTGTWQLAVGDLNQTVVAAVLILLAILISGLGFFVCCVGLIFTRPYGAAIIAGVLTWYERELAGPAPMPAQAA